MSELLRIAQEAALEAGTFLKESVGKVKNIETKKGEIRNLVSEIDRGSEERIIRRIRKQYPGHAILAEESGETTAGAEFRWIIDPLDGTTNFLHGLPIFSVTIAVEHRGEIVAGITYNPNMDELFVAEKGAGAFLNGERISVSRTGQLINSLVVTGFPYNIAENPDNAAGHFVNFLFASRAVRRLGSAAIDLAYVAMGRFDGFWEVSLQPWDMAAGVLLVHEAGGRTSDFHGNATSVYHRPIVASNSLIHNEMVGVLERGKS